MPFLQTSGVTEICINRPGEVFVEQDRQFTRHGVEELTLSFLETLASLIAEYNYLSFPASLISGALPSGERVQCVRPPACELDRMIYAIRRHELRDMSLDDYEEKGAFDLLTTEQDSLYSDVNERLKVLYQQKSWKAFLTLAVAAKKNILISGGTGTGKTTFLNACLKLIPPHERLITVEDTREVVVRQPNAAHLLFNEEEAAITSFKLFKVCLRLRPDRIFLSELRGAEVWPFLRAANSGHPGSLSTVHADTPQACFDQLVFMMQQAGSLSTEPQLRDYLRSIIPIVVQLKRDTHPDRFMVVSDVYFDALSPQI